MRRYSSLAAAAAVVSCTIALGPAASAQAPVHIGPNQYFQGNINGLHSDAKIAVICPGPADGLGHPVAGQPVQVTLNSSTTRGGFTGSLGKSIVASFGPSSGTPQLITFSYYDAPQDIPTGFWLPCSGTALVPFAPQPTSPTAITDNVSVTFVNVGA